MALTAKQELFIQEYLVDLNATQAYIRAGYEEKGARANAARLIANDSVRARIEEMQGERAEKLELDAQWVLNRLVDITDMCMVAKPVLKWDSDKKTMVESGEYQFDSQGANKAVELIGRHLSMFKDNVNHTGNVVIFNGESELTD